MEGSAAIGIKKAKEQWDSSSKDLSRKWGSASLHLKKVGDDLTRTEYTVTQPDPLVVNPSRSASRILGSHDLFCQSAVPHVDAPFRATLVTVLTIADDVPAPYRPNDLVLLSGQATDPSPPVQQPRRG